MKKMEAFKESVKQCKPEYLAVTLLLFVTILAGLAYLAFVPKQTFSEEENRALEEVPQLSLENLADGSFMSSAESYVGDHFMLRQAFISLSTTVKLGLGFRAVSYTHLHAAGLLLLGHNTEDQAHNCSYDADESKITKEHKDQADDAEHH